MCAENILVHACTLTHVSEREREGEKERESVRMCV